MLVPVTDQNWREFTSGDAVLVLGKTTCRACERLAGEIEAELAAHAWQWPIVGKAVLDKPGLSEFKQANAWLQEVDVLPYVVVYQHGSKADAGGGSSLVRLQAMLEHTFAGGSAPAAKPDGGGAAAKALSGGLTMMPSKEFSRGAILPPGSGMVAGRAIERALRYNASLAKLSEEE